jgi:hypothetical protein
VNEKSQGKKGLDYSSKRERASRIIKEMTDSSKARRNRRLCREKRNQLTAPISPPPPPGKEKPKPEPWAALVSQTGSPIHRISPQFLQALNPV